MTLEELEVRHNFIRTIALSLIGIFSILLIIMLSMYFTGNWRGNLGTIAGPFTIMAASATIFFSQMGSIKKEIESRG